MSVAWVLGELFLVVWGLGSTLDLESWAVTLFLGAKCDIAREELPAGGAALEYPVHNVFITNVVN